MHKYHEYRVELRHDRGRTYLTLPATSATAAVAVALQAEKAPASAVRRVLMRPDCDYCPARAHHYVRDSGDETPLCWKCAVDHYGTATAAREATGQLGPARFLLLNPTEWGGTERFTITRLARVDTESLRAVLADSIQRGEIEVEDRTATFYGPAWKAAKLLSDALTRVAVQSGTHAYPYRSLRVIMAKLDDSVAVAERLATTRSGRLDRGTARLGM